MCILYLVALIKHIFPFCYKGMLVISAPTFDWCMYLDLTVYNDALFLNIFYHICHIYTSTFLMIGYVGVHTPIKLCQVTPDGKNQHF